MKMQRQETRTVESGEDRVVCILTQCVLCLGSLLPLVHRHLKSYCLCVLSCTSLPTHAPLVLLLLSQSSLLLALFRIVEAEVGSHILIDGEGEQRRERQCVKECN